MKHLLHYFLLPIAALSAHTNMCSQTATVYLEQEKQTIQGFGAINHPTWTGKDLTDEIIQTSFGNGDGQLGFSVMRIWIDSDSTKWYKELSTAKKVIDDYGAKVFATPWNPPADLAETVNRNGRDEQRVKTDKYAEYAQHLNNFNDYMFRNGAPLYAISIANEPDYGYDWTWWSKDEIYNFVKNNAGVLRRNGAKVISHESFSYQKAYYTKILNDSEALANLDILGTHIYGTSASSNDTVFHFDLADQKAPGMERWMTEHYTSSTASEGGVERANAWPEALDVAYEMHRCMAEANFSAYVWWYLRRFYGPVLEDGTVSKRGYLMGQFSKFIRPGYVRVEADKNPTYNVYVSAYKNNDDVTIVAVNRSTVSKTLTFSVPNTKVKSWSEYVTDSTRNIQLVDNIEAADGTFLVTLAPHSATTFVGMVESVSKPEIELVSPTDNYSCVEGDTITLAANASVENGRITHIDYYSDGERIISKWLSPFAYDWTTAEVGTHKIWAVAYDSTGQSVCSDTASVTVNVPQSPYTGSPILIPGRLECENYDLGGEGYAYHDAEAENKSGAYRTDGVDIAKGATGYAVGYTIRQEWLEYTVDVENSGKYKITAYAASGNDNAGFRLLLDGEYISDTVHIQNNGDWTNYHDENSEIYAINAGEHILKIEMTGSYFNIDYIDFELITDETGVNDVLPDILTGDDECDVFTVCGIYCGRADVNALYAKSFAGKSKGIYLLRRLRDGKTFKYVVRP